LSAGEIYRKDSKLRLGADLYANLDRCLGLVS